MRKLFELILRPVPPFRKLLDEVDALRNQNGKLLRDSETLQRNLDAARGRCEDREDELARLKRAHTLTFAGSEALWMPPGHFYSPIPSFSELKSCADEVFAVPPAIRGVDLNEQRQAELLEAFRDLYREQPFLSKKSADRRYFFDNPNYSYTDAIILYSMIRYLQPRRIVEIGSGYSSCAMLDVNELFFDNSIVCTFIDPYPQLLRSLIKDSDLQRVRILGRKVQDVDLSVFRELVATDILFVDSSHVAKTGSDVNYILFKILPLLQQGVYIHFHDIHYPFEYPQDWVSEGRAWNEAYMLRAFLQYNRAFEIQFFTTYMERKHRDVFESDLPMCLKNTAGSLWLRKNLHDPELDRVQALSNRKTRPVPRRIAPYQPECEWLFGEGWYEREADHCWMTDEASIQIAGPEKPGQHLRIQGFSPHVNGVQLAVAGDDIPLGAVRLPNSGVVDAEFPLPESLVGRSSISVHLRVDRVYEAQGDNRKLGLSVTAIEIV